MMLDFDNVQNNFTYKKSESAIWFAEVSAILWANHGHGEESWC